MLKHRIIQATFLFLLSASFCANAQFRPDNLPGLQLWLSTDSGLVLNGSADSLWSDRSGNNNNAVQSVGSNQPLLISSVPLLNNLPVLNFDAIDDYLALPTIDFSTIIIVGKANENPFSDYRGLLGGPLSGTGIGGYLLNGINGTSRFGMGGDNSLFSIMEKNGNSVIATGDYSPVNRYWIGSFGYGLNRNQQSDIGRIDGGSQPTRYWLGDVAEVIVYNIPLSSTERQQVVQYLRDKYAPPVYLGTDIFMPSLCDTLLDASSRFMSYKWHRGDDTTVIDINPTLNVSNPGKYWVEATDVFGFTSSDTIYVTYSFNQAQLQNLICLGDTLHWNTNLDISNYSFIWNDFSSNSYLDMTQAGQYYVSVTENATGCVFNSDTIVVVVDSFPAIASLGGDTVSLCLGNSIGLVNGNAQAISYLWSTTETAAMIPIFSSAEYAVIVADINGCIKSDSIYASIIGIPPIVHFYSTTVCEGNITQFTDSSYDPTPGNSVQFWLWNFGEGPLDTLQNPSHVFLAPGNHHVILTVTSNIGCPNTDSLVVTVHPKPSASFVNTLPCIINAVQFNSTSTVQSPSVISAYDWNFGNPTSGSANDTSTQVNPTHRYDTTGNFVVRLITTTNFGCMDTSFSVLNVRHGSRANFQYLPTCYLDYVQFTNLSSPASLDSLYLWNFGDGPGTNPLPNPAHLYALIGTYPVTLTAVSTTGCVSSVTKPVTVSPIPTAGFVHSPACIGTEYHFIDSSYITSGTIVSWKWNFGSLDSSTQQNPTFTFPDTGQYLIKLTVTSDIGCKSTLVRNLRVHPLPVANFSFSPQFGNPPLNVTFTNLTIGGSTYEWNFGDGSPTGFMNNPQHLYADTNLYSIQLISISQYGCRDSISKNIYIIKPILDLSVTGLSSTVTDNHLQIKVALANFGTRTINDFKIEAQLENGTTIQETYVQTLPSGFIGELSLFTKLDLGSGQARYYCVHAVEPNGLTDDVPSNNNLCKSLTKEFSVVTPYPNPFNDILTLQLILPFKDQVSIELMDMSGKRISIFEGEGKEGMNQYDTDLSDLANGTYAIRFKFRDSEVIKSIIKMEKKK